MYLVWQLSHAVYLNLISENNGLAALHKTLNYISNICQALVSLLSSYSHWQTFPQLIKSLLIKSASQLIITAFQQD